MERISKEILCLVPVLNGDSFVISADAEDFFSCCLGYQHLRCLIGSYIAFIHNSLIHNEGYSLLPSGHNIFFYLKEGLGMMTSAYF